MVVGAREALSWVKDMQLDHIQVEVDALHVLHKLQSSIIALPLSLFVDDIKEIVKSIPFVDFLFVT